MALLCIFLFLVSLNVSAQRTDFDTEQHAPAPDYADPAHWSALPFRDDVADVLPKGETAVHDSLKKVDVFYVHPTIYQKGPLWNADLADSKLNRKVDKWPVRLQASVFNRDCRVYAPRYRQAVVRVFYQRDEDGQKALDLAYDDVKQAFQYFLEHHNNDRPFIIAGHSQGTYHTVRLLREMIDTTDLRHRMVAAYVIGLTVNEAMYTNLRVCDSASQTGCFLSWMTYREGFFPEWEYHLETECVNPLTWRRDSVFAPRSSNVGAVVMNPRRVYKGRTEARIERSQGELLWVHTRAPWFSLRRNLHVADYGLFYMDIRENVGERVRAFLGREARTVRD
jgi:hypothetical protein